MTDLMDHGVTDRSGDPVVVGDRRFLLVAPSGLSALVSTWGAALVALNAPDRHGRFADVVLGFDTAAAYASQPQLYFSCTIGRVSNRIRGASFRIGDSTYQLAAKNGSNHLHGGSTQSFDRVDWDAEPLASGDGPRVVFRHESPHLEEGYPGRLEVSVTYTLNERDELRIDYEARADRTTPISLTNHSYFNLAGAGADSILGHELQVWADSYTPTDDELIPTGEIRSVDGTALDFRMPTTIGARIAELANSGAAGYDHNYVLPQGHTGPTLAARLRDPESGRILEVLTTQPCIQLYSGNLMTPSKGKFGARYLRRSAVCLEPQGYPDAVHNPNFQSVLLDPDDIYRETIVFRMRTD